MFETSVVRAGAMRPRHHYRLLTLSLAAHSCALAVAVTATLLSTKLPIEAPRQMEILHSFPVVPPLGTPDGGGKPRSAPPQVKRIAVAPPAAVTAPPAIPPQTTPATTAATTDAPASTATDVGGGDGTESGGPGPRGVPWGDPNSTSTDTSGTGTAVPLRAGVGEVKAPIVLQRVLPEYPRVALIARKNGWVIVECIIDRTGHIRDAKVVGSSFAAFELPAIEAVQKWVFSPGTLHGEAVDTVFDLTVTFQVR